MVNRGFFIFFSTALVLLAVLVVTNVPVPRVAAANRSIVLIGSVSAWNSTTVPNPTITVTQGDVVSITLSSVDVTHQFALDVDKDGAKFIGSCPTGDICSSAFSPSSATSVTFTASFAPGTYTYFCTFHSTMVGSLVVNASTIVGGTVVPLDKLTLLVPYIGFASIIAAAIVPTAIHLRRRRSQKINAGKTTNL
jgi:plastocyanin